jgi:hypothetical protein
MGRWLAVGEWVGMWAVTRLAGGYQVWREVRELRLCPLHGPDYLPLLVGTSSLVGMAKCISVRAEAGSKFRRLYLDRTVPLRAWRQ